MNNPKQQIQITDLLAEAVANATERRELAAMNELSGEETQDIQGGSFYLINGGYPILDLIGLNGQQQTVTPVTGSFSARF